MFAGRENTDKERFVYDRIRERGGETFVLVPNQYTLVAEENALEYLGAECLFDTEILSMNRLGLRILTEKGTESVRMLDKYGRFMLLSRIIREHESDFEIFSKPAGKISFTSMLSDFISEFKQQDCSLEELSAMLSDAGGDPILASKLKELSGVVAAYEEAISGIYTDSEDYISMYIDAIRDSELVRDRTIWIYGYDSITPKFADAMMALSDVAESVNFIVNRSDTELDEKLTAKLERLAAERGADFRCEEIGAEYRSKKSPTIERIESLLWKDVISPAERKRNADFAPEDLTLVCAANPYYEAETAAAYVWHLIRDLGYKMSEIQIIANDEGSMQPVVRRVFEENGLAVFADTSRDITDSAPVCYIVNLLNFVRSRGQTAFLFAMLKTGLSGFSDPDIEDLENYARDYRIRGSMWNRPFRYGEEAVGEETFAKLESMRSALSDKTSKLAALSKAETTSAFIRSFVEYLEEEHHLGAGVEQAAAAQDEAGLHDEAQRMTQSYDKAVEILAQMDEILGGEKMDLAEFTDIYTAGLSDVEVGVIPPSADGLQVGTMIRTRPRRMKAAVILGANEGVMPLSPKTEGLFSADEKEYFKSRGFALGRLDELKMEEEHAAMYRMMARPSEKLYISWSMTDTEGKDASPSPVIDSLRDLFPRIDQEGLIRKDVISEGFSADVFTTPEAGMRHLINHIKAAGTGASPDDITSAAVKWYRDNRRESLDAMMEAAAYDNVPQPLRKRTAKELFGRAGGELVMSASSISSYVGCPFRYYVERGLRPKEERAFASDARSVGDVYHECLMAVAAQIMGDSGLLERLREDEDGELERIVSAALDEIAGSYRGGLFVSAGSEEYRMSRIREICSAAAKAMASQLTAESVTGAVFEEAFGRRGTFRPIEFTVGEDRVYVEGKIDRADYIDADGTDRVRIIDYKTGADRLDLWKMRQGIKMQLMIYLISAETGEREPAGMFYFNIKDPIEGLNDKSRSHEESVMDRDAEDEFRLKGVFVDEAGVLDAMPASVLATAKCGIKREAFEEVRADVIRRIEETAEGILSGKIGINPLKEDNKLVCTYCSYRSVCRRDRGYYRNKARTIAPKPKETGREESEESCR